MASAVTAITANRAPLVVNAMAVAAPRSKTSDATVTPIHRRRERSRMARVRRPETTAPIRKAAKETSEPATENPGAPTAAKARTTTLPVMLAVKTWPRPR